MAEENNESLPDSFATIYDDFVTGKSEVVETKISDMTTAELKKYSKDSPVFMQAYMERLVDEISQQNNELPEQ